MTWRPARGKEITPARVERAKAWLRSPQWQLGILETDESEGIQFRGAMHPNRNDAGKHRGVEVWVRIGDDDVTPTEVPSPRPVVTDITPRARGKVAADEWVDVISEGARRGWPPAELDAAIMIESGWDPHISNRSTNAGGLIGFMPFVLRDLGWKGSPESFRSQSARAQAPWIGRYYDSIGKRWRVPGDTYVALAAPAFVGARDSTIAYKRGSKAWELNPGWRGPDGEIRVGSIRQLLLRKVARLAAQDAGKGVAPPATKPVGPKPPASGIAALVALAIAYVAARWLLR
jgi:hypothetical protein